MADTVDQAKVYTVASWLTQQWLWSSDGKEAQSYLTTTRCIPEDVARSACVGFLPPAASDKTRAKHWSVLVSALLAAGVPEEMIEQSGLARRSSRKTVEGKGALMDFPIGGGYLVFPVRNAQNAIVGLKYRAVPKLVRDETRRHFATRGSPGEPAFGILPIPQDAKTAIVVEGELDQLSLVAACSTDPQVPPAIPLQGNALSSTQLKAITDRFHELWLMLDHDAGGWHGVLETGSRLMASGSLVKVIPLPERLDPNDMLVANGPERFAAWIKEAQRISLLEATAQWIEAQDISRYDPVWAARELKRMSVAIGSRKSLDRDVQIAVESLNLPVVVYKDIMETIQQKHLAVMENNKDHTSTQSEQARAANQPSQQIGSQTARARGIAV